MKRRFPLWLTLVPLIAAVAGYYWYWSGQRDAFRAEIARVLPGQAIQIGGFPYRLEATVQNPRYPGRSFQPSKMRIADPLEPEPAVLFVMIDADRATLNRGPWKPDLTLVRTENPSALAGVFPEKDLSASVGAKTSQSSLHLGAKGLVARFSTVLEDAVIRTAMIGQPVTASRFEMHFREIPGRLPEPWSPTLPERAQVVLAGEGVRLATGTPLKFAADLKVTGPTRLINYANWVGKGTVEIRNLTLSDTTGEVFRLNATLVAVAQRPRLAGTIVTVCPRTVQAALTLAPRVSEHRLRIPVKLALGGTPGAWTLTGLPATPRPVRAQLPACPAIR